MYQKFKLFEQPFAYTVMNQKVSEFCSHCLTKPEDNRKLQMCGGCQFMRYCNKQCQKAAWPIHKVECNRLKKCYPNLPLSEVIFMGRILDRCAFIVNNGDIHNWQKDRKFNDLMGHEEDIKNDSARMEHYDKIYEKTNKYFDGKMISKDTYFPIWCRTWINSHSIHTSTGTEVGMAIDLGVSKYDHSCRPNCTLVLNGFRAMLRPLTPSVNPEDPTIGRISYIDVGRSRYQRRRELKAKWYFWCQCERCMDPEEDRLTAIKCITPNCDEPIVINEETEPMYIGCPKCKNTMEPEYMTEAQNLMKHLPAKFELTGEQAQVEEIKELLIKAKQLLHPENIYHCRLLTVYLQIAGDDKEIINPEMHKLVYSNYRRCFPETDRHIGYQLLHLVKSLIEEGKRDEAVQYAYEAMSIFEVCFGLDHPYYLQTLALWTYLDTKADKTNEQLFQLMNFNFNKPVDLTDILSTKCDQLRGLIPDPDEGKQKI